MLSKIKTRFYVGNNRAIRITVGRAVAQAKTGGQRKSFEFPHFTGFLPRQQKTSYSCHWTDISSVQQVLYTTSYKIIYICVNYLIL
jgi:hypothetical protein